ncbi:hypothetical protein I6A84_01115 [Frankia sp. CNm7]|uniref:Uncharacterized protein n=1 Tax=Frankia nepalensis TaxID=1836974 RepID=A0A937USB3_9ACTN|nr:hypothetical protein [Frankia nepalensis]MBL7496143.1 hypothetical protein [Frankia nepalensis]MBL7508918.1 hypothetical protein [Frankia nepalensis]MBL7516758.1 hypothetical protein [Frankia nepalensis]MBL7628696.1 hypothetical protein [Frankia nepalensis]
MPQDDPPRTLLALRLRERGLTVERFVKEFNKAARRAGPDSRDHAISYRQATRWVSGNIPSLPYPVSCRVLEAMFGDDAATLLGPPDGPPRAGSIPANGTTTGRFAGDDGTAPPAEDEEAIPTRRRDLLNAGVIAATAATAATAGALVDPAARAASISRAIATSTPDPLTLAQLQHGIHRLATLYAVTPHAELVAPVEHAWDEAEALLETRVSGTARRDVELVAGQWAYYRGQLAFDLGDDPTALTFLVLAGQHADAVGDTLLAGSVAVMRSAVSFFAGDYRTAARLAAQSQPGAHPYIAPILAGGLARALALTGDTDGALDALRTMQNTIWTGEPLPGPDAIDEEGCELFTAVTLGYLGLGKKSEKHARTALTLLGGSGRHVALAGTHLALARAFLRRSKPEPEQAAGAIQDALAVAAGKDHGATTHRAAAIWRHLHANPGWTHLPAVRDLADQLPAGRALSPGDVI